MALRLLPLLLLLLVLLVGLLQELTRLCYETGGISFLGLPEGCCSNCSLGTGLRRSMPVEAEDIKL